MKNYLDMLVGFGFGLVSYKFALAVVPNPDTAIWFAFASFFFGTIALIVIATALERIINHHDNQ